MIGSLSLLRGKHSQIQSNLSSQANSSTACRSVGSPPQVCTREKTKALTLHPRKDFVNLLSCFLCCEPFCWYPRSATFCTLPKKRTLMQAVTLIRPRSPLLSGWSTLLYTNCNQLQVTRRTTTTRTSKTRATTTATCGFVCMLDQKDDLYIEVCPRQNHKVWQRG